MKTLKSYMAGIAVTGLLLTVVSCSKTFYTDANNNPNSPAVVPASVMLTNVEISLGYAQGGDMSRFTSLLTQQTEGEGRQSAAYYTYIFTGQDFDDLWGNMYTSVMENDKNMMDFSDKGGFNYYSGISRLLMAYSLQIMVDCWGNIPYSTALTGTNLTPTYDGAALLYGNITKLCYDGMTYLNMSNPGSQIPGGDDFIYGGDPSKWIKFGNAILARLYIHQSLNNASLADSALSHAALAMSANADNAQVSFGSSQTSANPWYQFDQQRGDILFAYDFLGISPSGYTNFADTLLVTHDPRFGVFIDSINDAGGFGLAPYYASINSPVELICYDEMQFVSAEAQLRYNGDMVTAATYYSKGLQANMDKLGVDAASAATYIASQPFPSTSPADGINQTARQEWVALFLNPEAWSTYRRTNVPNLQTVPGSISAPYVPRRFLYPSTEVLLNGSNVPAATLYAPKIFWD